MEVAYDLKDLGQRLEKAGLAGGEVVAAKVYNEVKAWAKESAVLSENKYDDLVAPFYDQLDSLVLPQIDKISPEVETK